jgi:hypothetical protein
MYYIDDCTYHQASSDQDMVQMLEKKSGAEHIDIFKHIHGVDENRQLHPVPPNTLVEVHALLPFQSPSINQLSLNPTTTLILLCIIMCLEKMSL